jgi:hypothetical protein
MQEKAVRPTFCVCVCVCVCARTYVRAYRGGARAHMYVLYEVRTAVDMTITLSIVLNYE